MRIAQLSDCHLYSDKNRCGYGNIVPYQSLQQVITQLNTIAPDMVLFTGDLSGDYSPQSYLNMQVLLQQLKAPIPVRMIAGNHDEPVLLAQTFPEYYRSDEMETVNGVEWLYLNTRYHGNTGRVDLAFFKDRIKQINHSDNPVVIVMHHHPLDSGSWMDTHELVNREEFCVMLQQIIPPTLLLHGHIHHASEKTVANVTVLSCPSTCWQWQMSEHFGVSDEQPGGRMLALQQHHQWQNRIFRIQP